MKTQIKKTILGNFSIFFGKFFGLFFVLLFNCFFSQIYISENTVLYINDEEIIVSSGDDISKESEKEVKIYIIHTKKEIENDPANLKLIGKRVLSKRTADVQAKPDTSEVNINKKEKIAEKTPFDAPEFLNTSNQEFRDSANGLKNYVVSNLNLKVQAAIIRILKKLHFSFETVTDRKKFSTHSLDYQSLFLFALSVRPPPFLLNI